MVFFHNRKSDHKFKIDLFKYGLFLKSSIMNFGFHRIQCNMHIIYGNVVHCFTKPNSSVH